MLKYIDNSNNNETQIKYQKSFSYESIKTKTN